MTRVELQEVAQLEEEKKHLEYMNSIKKYDDQQVIVNIVQGKLVHLKPCSILAPYGLLSSTCEYKVDAIN